MSDFLQLVSDLAPSGAITSFDPLAAGDTVVASGLSAGGAAWPAANRAIYIPFRLTVPVVVKQIAWENGSTVSGNVDVGVHDLNQNRKGSSGSVAMSGASAVQIADVTDITLAPGWFFMSFACDNATASFVRVNPAAQFLNAVGVQQQASAFPLPDPAAFANPASGYLPLMALLFQAVA